MNPMISLVRDRKFWIPVLVLICFDLCLQAGVYRPYLKKGSFAANVVRNTEYVLEKKAVFDPSVILLGTSVAHQGLSLRILNGALEPYGERVQSFAMEGTEIIVQDALVQKLLPQFPNVHTVIHVLEVSTPWLDLPNLELHTLSMLSELDRPLALRKIYDFGYNVHYDDLAFLAFKSVAYRRDMRDFFLDPSKRLKDIGRRRKEQKIDPWPYENPNLARISMYPAAKDVISCLAATNPTNGEPIPAGSDHFHKKAIWDTCVLAERTPTSVGKNAAVDKFFGRLRILYDDIRRIGKQNGKEIRIIPVLAPYSDIVKAWRTPERNKIWQEELEKILPGAKLLDYQASLDGTENGDYYYDLIHLNQLGMIRFSEAIVRDLPAELGHKEKLAK
ncbi:SGNH/GDSL hydrolase family protein [Leptospira fletcheri]|uniref:SGNH/GDSL hydrolase family protein n=1 Tax=Leptospira fletcheri TaxID=2484981 RepID=A0A4R9GD08_9LEPT|nr:SGNH/GDSL hydrolase family protein [Leptospira fletcheri]TGK08917.1 SGNH/GDSL hydrolase family protein [Leptospira fletcheri]